MQGEVKRRVEGEKRATRLSCDERIASTAQCMRR